MRRALATFGLAFAAVNVTAAARADEGELYVDAVVQPEVAWVSHPLAGGPLPFAPSSSFTFMPRVGALARYGLLDQLSLGLGVDVGITSGLTAKGVTLDGTPGDLVTATRVDVMVPLTVSWRFDTGYDFTGGLDLQAGPYLAVWAGNALGDPTNIDPASGLPSRLPVDISDQWVPGAFARISAAFEVRLFDVVVVAFAPSIAASWAGTVGVHAGLLLRPSFVFSPLPL